MGASLIKPGTGTQAITAALVERDILTSKSTGAPLLLSFPATLAPRWLPGLFPEKRG